MTRSLAGRLLIARPHLLDPNFHRTVVFICEHGEEGALGLVLNRPTDLAVGDFLPGWVEQLAMPDVVFYGGPVQPEAAVGLARRKPSAELSGWVEVWERVGLLDLSMPPAEVTGDLQQVRVYSGYGGWATGQLDFEVSSGDWFVVPARAEDVFGSEPETLWRRVLRRQKGWLGVFADFPLDPSNN